MRRTDSDMGSYVFSDEEAQYLKRVLSWQDSSNPRREEARRRAALANRQIEAEERREKPVGEFRILVIGAKGTGKTAILTRFGQDTFRGEDEPPDPFYERGCRHNIDLDGQPYLIDALEMPSKQISSNPMLEQALAITEAAVLVYDVRDPESLNLTKGLADFVRDYVGGAGAGRDYGLMLVGNKSDVDDEERQVSWAEGSRVAAGFRLPAGGICAFVEVSAKTGDNVDKVFPSLAREVMKLKRLGQQRREQAERVARLAQLQVTAPVSPLKRRGLWKSLMTPFFKR
ncbi:P-loop containing nucleoside triphosphate hydrolase protein [Coniochaeta ligniaria NRRL 30616]|uniref:small monomeric GTPase n=1 Tax=Coniochaeta ligniaria NRRL 30616 TaxID=1408157 RepID=A0A1J7IRG4_9PEZI|nr:P-loop containing nucleoside triphosphate hydrolase protein [Coniochaeta ligniaria NRRL 30616]